MNFIFDRESNLYLCLYNQLFVLFHNVFLSLYHLKTLKTITSAKTNF